MERDTILEIKSVTKMYSRETGIQKISFCAESGESIAIIGPNGSGKTTLTKAICGLNRLSGGEVLLDGVPTVKCRNKIGYMQENLDFFEKLTVYEVIDFLCMVRFDGNYYEEIETYLKRYNLYDQRNSKIMKLSLGMQRKLSIIMTLLGNSRVMLFDEPTNGIDTAGLIELKYDLLRQKEMGSILIITSHVLDWVEKVCTRFIFLKAGKITADLNLNDVKDNLEDVYRKIYLDPIS